MGRPVEGAGVEVDGLLRGLAIWVSDASRDRSTRVVYAVPRRDLITCLCGGLPVWGEARDLSTLRTSVEASLDHVYSFPSRSSLSFLRRSSAFHSGGADPHGHVWDGGSGVFYLSTLSDTPTGHTIATTMKADGPAPVTLRELVLWAKEGMPDPETGEKRKVKGGSLGYLNFAKPPGTRTRRIKVGNREYTETYVHTILSVEYGWKYPGPDDGVPRVHTVRLTPAVAFAITRNLQYGPVPDYARSFQELVGNALARAIGRAVRGDNAYTREAMAREESGEQFRRDELGMEFLSKGKWRRVPSGNGVNAGIAWTAEWDDRLLDQCAPSSKGGSREGVLPRGEDVNVPLSSPESGSETILKESWGGLGELAGGGVGAG